jgi:titin
MFKFVVALAVLSACLACGGSSGITPTNVAASMMSGQVMLSWSESTMVDSYMIMRASGSSAYSQVGQAAANATSYMDANIMTGMSMKYMYQVMAMKGQESGTSAAVSITVP